MQYVSLVAYEPVDLFREDPFVQSNAVSMLSQRRDVNVQEYTKKTRALYKKLGLSNLFSKQRAWIAAFEGQLLRTDRGLNHLYHYELALFSRLKNYQKQIHRNVSERSEHFSVELLQAIERESDDK